MTIRVIAPSWAKWVPAEFQGRHVKNTRISNGSEVDAAETCSSHWLLHLTVFMKASSCKDAQSSHCLGHRHMYLYCIRFRNHTMRDAIACEFLPPEYDAVPHHSSPWFQRNICGSNGSRALPNSENPAMPVAPLCP